MTIVQIAMFMTPAEIRAACNYKGNIANEISPLRVTN